MNSVEVIQGRLTWDKEVVTNEIDPTDIVLDVGSDKIDGTVFLSSGFIGLRVRDELADVRLDCLSVSHVANDAVQLWRGGVSIEKLLVDHCLDIEYSDKNHPDVFQAFAKSAKQPFGFLPLFDGLYIGSATVNVECHGEHDFKNGFVFTEVCAYRNISLFSRGLDFVSASKAPYFLDMTNAQNLVVGSADHPIDPSRVSGKGICIDDRKGGAPDCENIVIHAYVGLDVVLGESARSATQIIWYEKQAAKGVVLGEILDSSKESVVIMGGLAGISEEAASRRGIRNCNPGNIEHNDKNKWLGLAKDSERVGKQIDEDRFCVFVDPVYGIRALAKLLLNYQSRKKLKTIREMISVYAPANDRNNTAVYVAVVCAALDVRPDDVVSMRDFDTLYVTVVAIIEHENGIENPYDDDLIYRGLAMSGVDLPDELSSIDRGRNSKEMITGGTVIGGAAAVPAIEVARDYFEVPPAVDTVIVDTVKDGKMVPIEVVKPVSDAVSGSGVAWYEALSVVDVAQLVFLGVIAVAAVLWMLDRRLTKKLGIR